MNAVENKAYTDGFMLGVNAFSSGGHIDLSKTESWINDCLSLTTSEENVSVHERDDDGNLVKTSTIKISSRDKAARSLSGFCTSFEYIRRACAKKGVTISLTKIEDKQ
jgi:hypothetical protein